MTNIQIDHHRLVKNLLKKPSEITIDDAQKNLLHCILGISGEAGEILDCIKKHVAYGQPLDEEWLIEEMGDLEFYLEALRQHVKVNRDYILKYNINKLTKRYGQKYSDKAAKERADKEEEINKQNNADYEIQRQTAAAQTLHLETPPDNQTGLSS